MRSFLISNVLHEVNKLLTSYSILLKAYLVLLALEQGICVHILFKRKQMNKYMYEILKQQISICRSFKPVQYLVALSCQLLRQLASHLSKLQELLLKQLGVKFLI